MRRKKRNYFPPIEGAPAPVKVSIKRRVSFSEVDVMAIVWHGRYPVFFEEGSAALGRLCGLSYKDFYENALRAPIVQIHVDYHAPLLLDEEFTIDAFLVWSEGARLNTEYALIKSDGSIAATGYTVQMFVEAESGDVQLTTPPLLETCRKRWQLGEFACKK